MSQPVPLNYRVAAAQVSQLIEGGDPGFYSTQASPLTTIANSTPGASTVAWAQEPPAVEIYMPPQPADPDPEPGEAGAGAPY